MADWLWRPFGSKAEPVTAPEPAPDHVHHVRVPEVPTVTRPVARAARTIGDQVRQSGVKPKSDYFRPGIPPDNAEAWISHAVAQGWVVEDGDLLRPGPVSPYLPEPVAEGSGGWDAWQLPGSPHVKRPVKCGRQPAHYAPLVTLNPAP